jgi:hypothetical protein
MEGMAGYLIKFVDAITTRNTSSNFQTNSSTVGNQFADPPVPAGSGPVPPLVPSLLFIFIEVNSK